MSKEIEKKNNPAENTENKEQQYSLNDDRRVKVLSPGMMVVKRFFRNRIAVVGLVILAFMFVFSFVGGLLTPYKENQQFYRYDIQNKEFAGAVKNSEYRYVSAEGEKFESIIQARFIKAVKAGEDTFTNGTGAKKVTYKIVQEGEGVYRVTYEDGRDLGLASMVKVNPVSEGQTMSFEFVLNALCAYTNDQATFEADGKTYNMSEGGLATEGEKEVAFISQYIINPINADVHLSRELQEAIAAALDTFSENAKDNFLDFHFESSSEPAEQVPAENDDEAAIPGEEGEEPGDADVPEDTSETADYIIEWKPASNDWVIRQAKQTLVFDSYARPSWEHPLGTDRHGMDMLTRLMYGGRISLVIGIIVEFIGTFLGMIMGGMAGYFGKWVDNLIMRIVDIFYCIPSTPILIIIGAAMDALNVDPMLRLLYLMLILGFLNWPGMARLIRGQILSLREQEFMTATEAGGISVPRRIFKHLIPNVIPQIIVSVTMGMGGVIITEASLSFLGLGVRFPFASWGNIINDVNNTYVLQNYWFIWIPAGTLLLMTVLAFNLVGDGLRDAFDPKMKR